MPRMTKAKMARMLGDAQKKIAKVYMAHYESKNPALKGYGFTPVMSKDMEALDRIFKRMINRLK
ncbi:MAG TPA: hypothetical protein DG048_08560 [Pseudoalteromonas sp.]|nr:hypothetical protein [Pseudoalteromonas sp.]|tara:strand:+ start:1010 stop:1201 length:192 start_codon:yes stop_codon:yes gene_type:complete